MTLQPAYCRPEAYRAFRRELRNANDHVGLFRTAAAISLHEEPTYDLDESCGTLDSLASAVRSRVSSSHPDAVLAHFHDVMFDVVGFRGATTDYYNPANSYLPAVLNTHRGIPISLTLIYRTVGAKLGLEIEGVNAPGHFLAAVRLSDKRPGPGMEYTYVDPFYDGRLLTQDEAYTRISQTTGRSIPPSPSLLSIATPQQWLMRMLLNLQAVFASRGAERDLFAMQELQMLITEGPNMAPGALE